MAARRSKVYLFNDSFRPFFIFQPCDVIERGRAILRRHVARPGHASSHLEGGWPRPGSVHRATRNGERRDSRLGHFGVILVRGLDGRRSQREVRVVQTLQELINVGVNNVDACLP